VIEKSLQPPASRELMPRAPAKMPWRGAASCRPPPHRRRVCSV
jgi:hypothetical protein